MTVATVKEKAKGDSIVNTDINSDLQSYVTNSDDVDETNIRRGGLDRRNFYTAVRPVREAPTGVGERYTHDGTVTINPVPAAAPATPQFTATGYRLVYDDDDEAWEVVTSFEYDGEDPTTAGVALQVLYSFQLYYREDNAAAWVQMPATLRQVGFSVATAALQAIPIKGSIRISRNLRSLLGAGWGSNSAEVGVGIWEPSSGALPALDVNDMTIWVEKHKR